MQRDIKRVCHDATQNVLVEGNGWFAVTWAKMATGDDNNDDDDDGKMGEREERGKRAEREEREEREDIYLCYFVFSLF